MLENGERVEITVDLTSLVTPLGPNTAFSIDISPPTGSNFHLMRTTPASIEPVIEF